MAGCPEGVVFAVGSGCWCRFAAVVSAEAVRAFEVSVGPDRWCAAVAERLFARRLVAVARFPVAAVAVFVGAVFYRLFPDCAA